MKTDIEIARECQLKNIEYIANYIGIPLNELEMYGRYIAKIPGRLIDQEKVDKSNLILVTAITPTKAGIGKTTVSIGLALGLNKLGKKAVCALREPSLGPCFGVKGGAAGGGYAQVLPMEKINLHFTGDFHAITSAHNMISALLDNYIYQHRDEGFALKEVLWKRVIDINDRNLRYVVTGLGAKTDGITAESGFDITPASEIMAILCLSKDLDDLRRRIDNIILGIKIDDQPFRVKDMGVGGAITVLLKDAIEPNLVQTTEQTPAFVHGGPFANIAHGCNSILATKMAMTHGDYVITEAGFAADLGAEKFLDIKCRMAGLTPDAVVIVATVRALKMHGGLAKTELGTEDLVALEKGIPNLLRHVSNIKNVYKLPCVVAVNRFPTDTDNEIKFIMDKCAELGVNVCLSTVWADGGNGGMELAKEVVRLCEEEQGDFTFSYELDVSIEEKIKAVATKVYGGKDISILPAAAKQISRLAELGYDKVPVCIAKTQYSFSDDPKLLGAPEDFTVTIRNAKISAGAGFIVALAGDIMTMPGLPKAPAAEKIDVDANGVISGLF